MHYYTFYPKDYASKASFLEPMEDLAYRRMLDLYYLTEKPLPSDIDEIALLIRMRSHCDCIATVLRYFFELTASGYINKKVETILDEYHQKSVKAKASADARWAKVKEKNNRKSIKNNGIDDICDGNANALRDECEGNANHKPITNNHKPIINNIDSDKPKRFMFKNELLELGCDSEVVETYMALRKTKKASNSKIAFDGLIREQQKSGMDLNGVMRLCIEKGWRGFEASWVNKSTYQNNYQQPVNNTFNRLGQLADEWDRNNADYKPY